MELSSDLVNIIYSYIDFKEQHKNNFKDTLFLLDTQKKPMTNFKSYFINKYKESRYENNSFFHIKFLVWEIPEKRWRKAIANYVDLLGGYLNDKNPETSVIYICAQDNLPGYVWDFPGNTWWKLINST